MARSETTSLMIDDIIRLGVAASLVGAVVLGPNMLIALDKPLGKLLRKLDKRDEELHKARELKRIIAYMKAQGYLAGEYEHGLHITNKAKKRLLRREATPSHVTPQSTWDKTWRIIIYDIPNTHSDARHALRVRLRTYGCFHLQRSVLITPFPCFEDVRLFAAKFGVEKYVSYFETTNLANDRPLIDRFAKKYPDTIFK